MPDRPAFRVEGRQVLDRCDDPSHDLGLLALGVLESSAKTSPGCRHERDEQLEILHAGVTLGGELGLKTLEAADRLVEKATDLGDLTPDGKHVGSESFAHCHPNMLGDGRSELGSS